VFTLPDDGTLWHEQKTVDLVFSKFWRYRYLEFYNRERAHCGYRTQGRTPYQAFLEGLLLRPQREAA
jgi:hypothetical protein